MKTFKGTTFDDVFRTIVLKMPYLVIALINEVFGETYSEDAEIVQHRNEFVSDSGKIITDSIFSIGGKYYHIECQSNPDSTMEIRMIEYDFAIAHEHAEKNEQGYVIKFPESAVLYLRHNSNTPDILNVSVEMPGGQTVHYSTKVVKVQNYTKDEIFQKHLLIFVPYYLMRYEDMFDEIDNDKDKRNEFLAECEDLRNRIKNETEGNDVLYADLINLIIKVSNHMLVEHSKTKKGVKNIMGGKILELSSEKLIKKGRAEGGNIMLYSLVADGELSIAKAAKKAGVSEEQFCDNMIACGYNVSGKGVKEQ